MIRLANAQPEPYRTLSALLGGTGIEISVALALHARDVDTARREIRAAGTKTHARDRIVRVAEWAWPYVAKHMALLTPNAPIFPHRDRWRAQDHHQAAYRTLGIEDYRIHDQRHSYAVRAARAGTPAELIARQLGHANAILVLKIYGRFMPSQQERDKRERIAASQGLTRAPRPMENNPIETETDLDAQAEKALAQFSLSRVTRLSPFQELLGAKMGTATRPP